MARNVPFVAVGAARELAADSWNSEGVVEVNKGYRPLRKEEAPVVGAAHAINPFPFLIGDSPGT